VKQHCRHVVRAGCLTKWFDDDQDRLEPVEKRVKNDTWEQITCFDADRRQRNAEQSEGEDW